MENPGESKTEAAIRMIIDILTDDRLKIETQLNVLRGFKLTLNKIVPTLESKIINNLDIKSLFNAISVASSNESRAVSTKQFHSFHEEYFLFLLNLAKNNVGLHDQIRLELLRILRTNVISDLLINNLWTFLESKSLFWLDVIQEILPLSKLFFEEKIFEWVCIFIESKSNLEELNVKYFAQLSVHCCDIFQIIATILNEFVNMTEGNERILMLVSDFASLVARICEECGKEFFKLYPRSLCHLISLLMITPKMYSTVTEKVGENFCYREEVLELLSSAFLSDENNVLQMLTHFPQWLMDFGTHKNILAS